MPAKIAQKPTTYTSTSTVGAGQASANTPAAISTRASSRWPRTGPKPSLLNAREPCVKAALNAYTANRMTRTRTVTPGQASATIPAMIASAPTTIIEVEVDLNMKSVPSLRYVTRHTPAKSMAAGMPNKCEQYSHSRQ